MLTSVYSVNQGVIIVFVCSETTDCKDLSLGGISVFLRIYVMLDQWLSKNIQYIILL